MKYSFDSRVRFSETDESGKLSLTGLVNYFQDCSTFQSEAIGRGIRFLKDRHQAWLLASWQIQIGRLPVLGERVQASTWPYEFKSFYGLRNFLLTGGDGQPAAWANSVWILLDTQKQRPVKVSEEEAAAYGLDEKYQMEYAPRKIRLPAASDDISQISHPPIIIGREHLDTNHHVNNGQYIALAVALLPDGFRIRQMRAEYLSQARLGNHMYPVVYLQKKETLISLSDEEGRPYALVSFEE